MQNSHQVRYVNLAPVIHTCTRLTRLDLLDISVSPAGFLDITKSTTVLRHKSLTFRFSNQQIVEGFSLLSESLTSFTGGLHEEVVFQAARYWHKMTRLSVSVCKWSDLLLEHVAEHCTNLRSMGILSCTNAITDTGLAAAARHMVKLASLKLCCPNAGDAGVIALARHCTSLTKVHLESNRLTDTGARALLAQQRIRDISLDRCPLVSAEVQGLCDARNKP